MHINRKFTVTCDLCPEPPDQLIIADRILSPINHWTMYKVNGQWFRACVACRSKYVRGSQTNFRETDANS